MILSHNTIVPVIHKTAFVAQDATVSGNVTIGENTVIMSGARLIAEGFEIRVGSNCVVLENAVLRSTDRHPLSIGDNVLIGPQAHVVGCTVEDEVFIATGASIFHGAKLCRRSEVRINGVVHIKSVLREDQTVPIGWIGVGDPIVILPPEKHDEIWSRQKPLNFPLYVYGIDRPAEGESNMPQITRMMIRMLKSHREDTVVG